MKPRRRLPLLSAGGRHDRLRATLAELVGEYRLVPVAPHGDLDVYLIDGTEGHGLLAERREGRSRLRGHVSAWLARQGRADSLSLEADLGPAGVPWAVTLVEPGGIPAMLAGIDPEWVRLLAGRHEPRLLEESDRFRAVLDAMTARELLELRRTSPGAPRIDLLERRLASSRRERIDPEYAERRAIAARERRRVTVLQQLVVSRARRRVAQVRKEIRGRMAHPGPVDEAEFWAAFERWREESGKLMLAYGIDVDAMLAAAEAGHPVNLDLLARDDEEEDPPPWRRGPGH